MNQEVENSAETLENSSEITEKEASNREQYAANIDEVFVSVIGGKRFIGRDRHG